MTPHPIVDAARLSGASSIAYTFTEPTVFFELAYDTAVLARLAGLRNVFVTSGYTSEAPLLQIAAVLDAVNVDLKDSRSESYRRVSKARLEPVLNAIRLYRELGVWVEVSTLVIPGINDSEQELRGIAGFIRSVGEEVPWHVTRFPPAHRMFDRPSTPLETLRRARQIGRDAGLHYVYLGNVPGAEDADGENTCCPACATLLVTRRDFAVPSNRVRDGRCPVCGALVAGVHMDGLEHPASWRAHAR